MQSQVFYSFLPRLLAYSERLQGPFFFKLLLAVLVFKSSVTFFTHFQVHPKLISLLYLFLFQFYLLNLNHQLDAETIILEESKLLVFWREQGEDFIRILYYYLFIIVTCWSDDFEEKYLFLLKLDLLTISNYSLGLCYLSNNSLD